MARDFEVVKGVRTGSENDEVEIDVGLESSVNAAFQIARPEIVLLFAALSDIDQCERRPEAAKAVNVGGAGHVVKACRRTKARLLYTSSAAVFDGEKHGYREQDPLSPTSVYGRTKAKAEEIVLGLGTSALILRIALALGFAGEAGTNALMDKMEKCLADGETVELPDYEMRNPIDAETFCRFTLELLNQPDIHGIFHLGASEPISRYELGLRLAARMGYGGLVRPQQHPDPKRAPRGRDHFLLPDKIAGVCSTAIPTCDQVIERCFDGFA
jgi:dTDP-4-dehydrorhamnose reductase